MGGVIKGGKGLMIDIVEGSLVISVFARSERVIWIIVIEDSIFIVDVWDGDVCVKIEGRCLHFSYTQWWWKRMFNGVAAWWIVQFGGW